MYRKHYRFYSQGASFSPMNTWTPVVKWLIIANIACFIFSVFLQTFILSLFALVPPLVLKKYYLWQLVTYMFLHGSIWHLLLNMFVLWMFGSEIERYLGSREFLKYYFICGLGAALTHILFYYNSPILVVGASGAIYGLLAAYALYFGDRLILFMFFMPMRARTFVILVGGIELLSSITPTRDGVAHLAHFGGLIVGFIYLYYWKGGKSMPRFQDFSRWWKMRRLKKKFHVIQGKDVELDEDEYKWH